MSPIFDRTQSQRRGSSLRSRLHTTQLLAVATLLCAAWTSGAEAQSWSSSRPRPPLRHLVSVDATGEAIWPYGQEDIAKDGPASFAADEAGADVRTVYADADAQRVWLRAYVAAEAKPLDTLVAFFFADTDDRDRTGGPAFGQPLFPVWNSDPTPGGYERAIGVRGDGTLIGVWTWDDKTKAWKSLTVSKKDDARVESGRDEDPIRIGVFPHGYVQVDVIHALSGLTASCAGNLFVRTWHEDAMTKREFGDDDAEVFACRPPRDTYGDPIVIRSVGCDSDRECPNNGRCRERVCLYASPCTTNVDCREDERCTAGSCIRVVSASCNDNADCRGLVCESGACVACSESGARACAAGFACSPNGICVDPGAYEPGRVGDGGVGGAGGPDAGIVRGGAFHCTVGAVNERGLGVWVWGLACVWFVGRRSRRDGRAS